jgi:hypothetical protein
LKVGRTLLIWLKTHRIGDSPPIRESPIFLSPHPFQVFFPKNLGSYEEKSYLCQRIAILRPRPYKA